MRRLLPYFLLLPAVCGLLAGCTSENVEDLTGSPITAGCDTTSLAAPTYAAVIRPIIETNCKRCHWPGGEGATLGGYQLDTYNGLKQAVDVRVNGQSLLVGVTDHLSGFAAMPKDTRPTKIPACDIEQIKRWVRRGAPND